MTELFERRPEEFEILPARKLKATVAGVFTALHGDFQTGAADFLELGFDGIARDFHAGYTRRSGSREPWYQRGTEMRNERQLSILSPVELQSIADAMGIAEVRPEWVGANLTIDGIPHLSMLPSGTLLFFANGVTIKVDAQNHPCRLAGRTVADHAGMGDREEGALSFVKSARRLRGLVAWVEKPGSIEAGEAISVRLPEQWVYRS